ncbi:hypothetical protein Fcan01_16394 [Folsomia candida]|uniref:Gustatory receptor n=1 Tax=Folsomia candida TaxID=158441 RepID=A0A226DU99_FOLCA|nr:hypothetical protein Fcan01_16394 [Folsomia candida]
MYSTYFLPFLLRHIKIGQKLKSIPYEFSQKSGKLVITKDKTRIWIFRLQIVLHLMYCIAMLIHLCFGPSTVARKLQGFVFFCMYTVVLCGRWNYDVNVAPIQVINSAMEFEKKVVAGKPDWNVNLETILMKLLLQLVYYTIFAVPVAKLALILLDPCSPPFLLSMWVDCSSVKWTKSFGYQNLILIFDIWMNIHAFIGGSFEILYVYLTGIVCLLNYFDVLRRDIRAAEKAAQFKSCTCIYRSIQILEKLFNGFLMLLILPSFMIFMPTLQVLLQYVCIMMNNDIPKPAFLMFILVWMNVFVNNVLVFTLASWVNNVSIKVLKENEKAMIHMGHATRRSAIMKEVKASTVLKIKFGSNFIDSGTPLGVPVRPFGPYGLEPALHLEASSVRAWPKMACRNVARP